MLRRYAPHITSLFYHAYIAYQLTYGMNEKDRDLPYDSIRNILFFIISISRALPLWGSVSRPLLQGFARHTQLKDHEV